MNFEGRRVLVTGAAQGIGTSIVRNFASAGAMVAATDILEDKVSALRNDLPAGKPGRIVSCSLDVSDEAGVAATVREMQNELGGIDTFVHVAGGTLGQVHQPVETVSLDQWDAIFKVNLRGAFLVARQLVPGMKERGFGRIVLLSSGAGLGVSMTGIQAYASAKAGQLGFVRQLGYELGPYGITVNAVAPGFLLTNPDNDRQWASYGEEGQKQIVQQIPRRRLGKPEDIAYATMFFASELADWITCQVLSVSGGYVKS